MKNRNSGLDFLRVIAIILVMVSHSNGLLGNNSIYNQYLGNLGVEIFFVLSGFLITSKLIALEQINLRGFYLKRALRIIPNFYLSIIVFWLATLYGREGINLFEEKPCIVTPTKKSSRNTLDKTMKFWSELNMYVYELLPEEHDDAVSYFSHLPHLISSCLAHNLEKKPETWRKISGNGIRDTTRIAAGDPDLWRQIFMMNKEKLLFALEDWEQSLMNFKDIIKNDDNEKILSFLKKGAKFRKGL